MQVKNEEREVHERREKSSFIRYQFPFSLFLLAWNHFHIYRYLGISHEFLVLFQEEFRIFLNSFLIERAAKLTAD